MSPRLPHDFPFDPTYGYTLDRLLALRPPTEPAGFETFWRETFDTTTAVPLAMTSEPVESRDPAFRARLIHFDGFEGVRLGGWLIEPADAQATRFAVVGHGYYNRPFEDLSYEPGVAALFMCCRGLGASRCAAISDVTAFHVLHGIEAKETYVHRGCVADTWSAASAVLELFPHAAGRLEYRGGSFGGGIGAMALPWDDRFVFAALGVPSFGNHPLRVTLPCVGSGAAVGLKWERDPAVLDVLAYFDAATHAARIRIPTHVTCAVFDPAVPPPGQFSVFNAIASQKKLHVIQAGHFQWAGTAEDDANAAADCDALRYEVLPH